MCIYLAYLAWAVNQNLSRYSKGKITSCTTGYIFVVKKCYWFVSLDHKFLELILVCGYDAFYESFDDAFKAGGRLFHM